MRHLDDNYLWNEIQNGINNNVQNNSFWINIELELMHRIADRKAKQSDKPEVGELDESAAVTEPCDALSLSKCRSVSELVESVKTNEKIRKFDKRQQNDIIIRA